MKNKNALFLIVIVSTFTLLGACGKESTSHMHTIDSLKTAVSTLNNAKVQLELNKKLVADFYQEVFGDKNVDAIDKYVSEKYIQHNPVLADGRDVLKQALTEWYKGAPNEKIDVHHLSAEGDLVYIHTKSTEGGKVVSIIDIFRLENGKIAEHWDVIQPVPEKSANPHPMF